MSLYHEAAALLSAPTSHGGSLKSRVFGKQDLKSPPAQVYALALESCKWSSILKEVIENAKLLREEHKLTPILSLLLVHDLLISKKGIALPQTHGLRASVQRHHARLSSELIRARVRRRCASLEHLRALVEAECGSGEPAHPRWIRVNTLKTTLTAQLETTFTGFEAVPSVQDVTGSDKNKVIYIDVHVPNLVAIPPGIHVTKTEAYKTGAIILQDKASCFPAYLLDPQPEDGDVIDSCAAPGNKTTHLAAILQARNGTEGNLQQRIHAFEKDRARAKTLEQMVERARSGALVSIHHGQDFLKVDPASKAYQNVGALLLDPSCSGSGIIGRDDGPKLHLPDPPPAAGASIGVTGSSKGKHGKMPRQGGGRKRKRDDGKPDQSAGSPVALTEYGENTSTVLDSDANLQARVAALASFQLALLQHALSFPNARKVTYSSCSVHAEENEEVVMRALASDVAQERRWRLLPRAHQVRGMREWPMRGSVAACRGSHEIAEACIRAGSGDGQGTMGFFVAAFHREGSTERDGTGRVAQETSIFKAAGQQMPDFGAETVSPDQRGSPGVGNSRIDGASGDSGSQGLDGAKSQTPHPDALCQDRVTHARNTTPAAKRRRDAITAKHAQGDVVASCSENEDPDDDEWTGFTA